MAVRLAGGTAYGLARGTGWVLENTLFRPQQGSENAAQQHERRHSAPALHAAQQHFRQPASSRRLSQLASKSRRSWGLNPVTLSQFQPKLPGSFRGSGQSARAACLRRATTSCPRHQVWIKKSTPSRSRSLQSQKHGRHQPAGACHSEPRLFHANGQRCDNINYYGRTVAVIPLKAARPWRAGAATSKRRLVGTAAHICGGALVGRCAGCGFRLCLEGWRRG